MSTLVLVVIIVLIIIILWKIFDKKNNYEDKHLPCSSRNDLSYIIDENAKAYKDGSTLKSLGTEYVDLTPLIDSCGKDFTYSSRLLKDLYGPGISDKILIFNKNDDLLYSHKWTSANVCKNIDESNRVKFSL